MEAADVLVTLGIVAVVAIGGAVAYRYVTGRRIKRETVDGEVCFDDAVAWFKEQNPQRNENDCIAVKDTNSSFRPLLKKDGYESIGLFVIEKGNQVKSGLIIHAKRFDDKTKRMFGNADIIKLV